MRRDAAGRTGLAGAGRDATGCDGMRRDAAGRAGLAGAGQGVSRTGCDGMRRDAAGCSGQDRACWSGTGGEQDGMAQAYPLSAQV